MVWLNPARSPQSQFQETIVPRVIRVPHVPPRHLQSAKHKGHREGQCPRCPIRRHMGKEDVAPPVRLNPVRSSLPVALHSAILIHAQSFLQMVENQGSATVPRDGLVYPQIHTDCLRLICVDKCRFVEKNQMVNYQLHISNRSNYDIIPGHAHSFSICFPGILCAFGILSCWFHVDLCAF